MPSLYVPLAQCLPPTEIRSREFATAERRGTVVVPSNITARYIPMPNRSAAGAAGWRASIARRRLELAESVAGITRSNRK